MNSQKGFSLLEVLLSLMLISSVTVALFQQLLQSRQLLSSLITNAKVWQLLEQHSEKLWTQPYTKTE